MARFSNAAAVPESPLETSYRLLGSLHPSHSSEWQAMVDREKRREISRGFIYPDISESPVECA